MSISSRSVRSQAQPEAPNSFARTLLDGVKSCTFGFSPLRQLKTHTYICPLIQGSSFSADTTMRRARCHPSLRSTTQRTFEELHMKHAAQHSALYLHTALQNKAEQLPQAWFSYCHRPSSLGRASISNQGHTISRILSLITLGTPPMCLTSSSMTMLLISALLMNLNLGSGSFFTYRRLSFHPVQCPCRMK